MTADNLLAELCGTTLTGLEADEFSWSFSFANGATVTTPSIWRALTDHGIAITSKDHLQQFGLPEPVDAAHRAASVLLGEVTSAVLMPITGDLRISFSSGSCLELLNTSAGYEGWHLVLRAGECGAREMVALGGGDVAIWSTK